MKTLANIVTNIWFRIFLLLVGFYLFFAWSGDIVKNGYGVIFFFTGLSLSMLLISVINELFNRAKEHKDKTISCSNTDLRVCAICPEKCKQYKMDNRA